MKRIIKIILLSSILVGCNNISSSSINSFTSNNSISLFNNSSIITDLGSSSTAETYYVEGKVETSKGERVLPFNTQMFLSTYSPNVYNKLGPLYDFHVKRLHKLFDRYHEYYDENGKIINNLKVINDSYAQNKEIVIDEDLYSLLEMSIDLAKLTEGYFNPTMGSLIDGWNGYFSPYGLINENFTIEDEKMIIKRKNSIVDYQDLEKVIELNKEKSSIKFNRYDKAGINSVIISLGAIAKGYAVDYFRTLFSKHEIPLIISGSASSTYVKGINPNPNRDYWTVLINSPYKDEIFNSKKLLLCQVDGGTTLSTSGDYEQLFYYQNGNEIVRRHHILNPYSGHSEDYYRSVSLISNARSDILDGLSTALFNINNISKIKEIINSVEEFYDLKINYLFQEEISENKVKLYLNQGFESLVSQEYQDIEILGIERI